MRLNGTGALLLMACIVLPALQAQEQSAQDSQEKEQSADEKRPDADPEDRLGDIVVTARRADKLLRKVSASTTVLSADEIGKADIGTTLDLDASVPGLTVREAGDRKSPFLAVRGLVNTPNGEHTTAIYVDDVPVSELRAVLFDLYAVERVEVLKGPQTTRFGKNNETGVINITTKEPEDRIAARVESRYGNYDTFRTEGYVNAPLISKKAYMVLSGVYSQRDGYIKNTFRGSSFDQRENVAGRAKFHFTPIEHLDLTLMAEGQHASDGPQAFALLSDPNPFNLTADNRGRAITDSYLGAFRLKYLTPWFELTSVTARKSFDSDHVEVDLDLTPTPISTLHDEYEFTQWTQEFRLASTERFGNWDWFAGFYFEDRGLDPELGFTTLFAPFIQGPPPMGLGLPFSPPVQQRQLAHLHHRTWSGHGEATYRFNRKWDVTFGLRAEYSRSELFREANITAWRDGVVIPISPVTNQDSHSTAVLPKVVLTHRPRKNILAYALYSQGYRPSGFSYGSNDPALARYDKEHLHNFELGLKTSWLENRLTFDLSLYHMKIRDYQMRRLTGVNSVVLNAEEAHSTGVELAVSARPVEGLTLNFGFAFNDAEYDEFLDPTTGLRFDGNTINLARKYDLTLSAQYKHPSGFFARGELVAVGKYPYLEDNLKEQGAYELFNAKLGYERDRFGVYLYGRNLFNRTYYQFALIAPSGTDWLSTPGAPQTFGIMATFKY